MKNIILIGMMGCGKTTCGGLLSRRLDRELVDTDALIAAREGRSIPEIFAAQGEDRFRELERGVAEELARREGEDDCLESWQQKHSAWFAAEAGRLHYDFRQDLPVILETFEVIWKG